MQVCPKSGTQHHRDKMQLMIDKHLLTHNYQLTKYKVINQTNDTRSSSRSTVNKLKRTEDSSAS